MPTPWVLRTKVVLIICILRILRAWLNIARPSMKIGIRHCCFGDMIFYHFQLKARNYDRVEKVNISLVTTFLHCYSYESVLCCHHPHAFTPIHSKVNNVFSWNWCVIPPYPPLKYSHCTHLSRTNFWGLFSESFRQNLAPKQSDFDLDFLFTVVSGKHRCSVLG